MPKFSNEEFIELVSNGGGKFAVKNIYEADLFCRSLTLAHYENFPIGSILIPKNLRKHFYSIYSFARLADDIADENVLLNKEGKIFYLNNFLEILKESEMTGYSRNPVIFALCRTIKDFELPILPFEKLIIAFLRDTDFKQPHDWGELLDYCFYSANPIGELILRLFDNYNEQTSHYSDCICTALQLVNFWQDLSIDIRGGRVYIPQEILEKYGIDDISKVYKNNDLEKNLFSEEKLIILNKCLNELFNLTEELFTQGTELLGYIKNRRLRAELASVIKGGSKIQTKCRTLGACLLQQRPKISKIDYLSILFQSLFPKYKKAKWKPSPK